MQAGADVDAVATHYDDYFDLSPLKSAILGGNLPAVRLLLDSGADVDCKINSGGVGMFVNAGLNATVADCFLLGIFGEYSYEKKKICPKRPNVYSNGCVQIGGFAFGMSLGYAF